MFIKKLLKNLGVDFDKYLFSVMQKISPEFSQFKIKIDTKCLVLSPSIGDETTSLGGLIAQFPKNFEILALTNGSSLVSGVSQIESINIKRQQFIDVMKLARVKGFKVFDINCGTLGANFDKVKKIDISEADFIFIPHIYGASKDALSLLGHFKEILKTKEYKKELKILMYENKNPLCSADFYADITNIVKTKQQMLEIYYKDGKKIIEGTMGLNRARAMNFDADYCECFKSFTPSEFMAIPFV